MVYKCPVLGREIDSDDCFVYALAVEGVGPTTDYNEMRDANADCDAICMSCEHHPSNNE